MVMGHTTQRDGNILARCKDGHHRLFVIDVGISQAYNSLGSAALEIIHNPDGSVKISGIHPGRTIIY